MSDHRAGPGPVAFSLVLTCAPSSRGAEVRATVSSIVGQRHPYWQLVLLETAPSSVVEAVADLLPRRDDRRFEHVVAPAEVSPVPTTRALDRALHQWLLFLEPGDTLAPDLLVRVAEASTERKGCDVVHVAFSGPAVVVPWPVCGSLPPGMDLFTIASRQQPFPLAACCMRRPFLERAGAIDPTLTTVWGWDLCQRLGRAGARVTCVPERLVASSGSVQVPASSEPYLEQFLEQGLVVIKRGHGPDPRVSAPHRDLVSGVPEVLLPEAVIRHVVSCAAAAIALERDPSAMLEALAGVQPWDLDGIGLAQRIQHALAAGCASLDDDWRVRWPELKPAVTALIGEIAERVGGPDLAAHIHRHLNRLASEAIEIRNGGAVAGDTGCEREATGHPPACTTDLAALVDRVRAEVDGEVGPANQVDSDEVCDRTGRQAPEIDVTVFDAAHFDAVFNNPDPWGYDSPYEQTKRRHALELLPPEPIRAALEVGCAEGHFTRELALRVGRVTAVDLSRVALARAAERCADLDNIDFMCLDAASETIPGDFDLVVCSEVLHYLGDEDEVVRFVSCMAKRLRPNGWLLTLHSCAVADEPYRTGFNWGRPFGAVRIGEIVKMVPQLRLASELRTDLYRAQLLRVIEPSDRNATEASDVIEAAAVVSLTRELSRQVVWGGYAVGPEDARRRERSASVPILAYHVIADQGPRALDDYRVSADQLEDHLAFLRRQGFIGLTVSQWLDAIDCEQPIAGRPVLLTFDDACRTVFSAAWPLLHAYGFPATLFVPCDHVGRRAEWNRPFGHANELMGWDEIRRLEEWGMEIGAHGASHRRLTRMSLRESISEGVRSRTVLKQRLGVRAAAIAYPYGDHDPALASTMAACGFRGALTCEPRASRLDDDRMCLPRFVIGRSHDLDALRKILDSRQEGSSAAVGPWVGRCRELERRLSEADRMWREKDRQLADVHGMWHEKDGQIAELTRSVKARDEELAAREQRIHELEGRFGTEPQRVGWLRKSVLGRVARGGRRRR